MCGRFTQHYTGHAFLTMFGPPRNLQPHYSIAPTDVVEVIRPCGSTLILSPSDRDLLLVRQGAPTPRHRDAR
jgi:putative SOS response-associated peptidase YedK